MELPGGEAGCSQQIWNYGRVQKCHLPGPCMSWGMLEMRNIQAHGESSKAAALDCEFNSVAVACKIVIVNLHLHRVGRGVLPFTDDK